MKDYIRPFSSRKFPKAQARIEALVTIHRYKWDLIVEINRIIDRGNKDELLVTEFEALMKEGTTELPKGLGLEKWKSQSQ